MDKKELIMENLKWVLDFKALDEISKNGKAEISVKELTRMCEEQIRINNDIINTEETSKDETLIKMLDQIKEAAKETNKKLEAIKEILQSNEPETKITFYKGC